MSEQDTIGAHKFNGSGMNGARTRISAAQVKAYARRIRILKILVPVFGLGFLGTVIGWSYLRDYESGFTLSFHDLSKSEDQIRMIDPRYTGVDAYGRRFQISANSAVQSESSPDEVRLEKIHASVTLKDKSDVNLTAASGVYNPHKEQLELLSGIRIVSEEGYEFIVQTARYDLHKAIASSQDPVKGKAPFGRFTADSFSVNIDGRRLQLDGHVQVRILPGNRLEGDHEPAIDKEGQDSDAK